LIGTVTLITQAMYIDKSHWQTMTFTVLCFSQMGHVFAIRSDYQSLFRQGIFSNRPLLGAVLLTLLLQLAIIYVPFFNPVFHTAPLTIEELMITLALSTIVFIAVEIEKWIKRRRYNKRK
jgi:Ca2+-transporting ATPase